MMIPMVNEVVRCLEEGIIASPAEADMALVYGYFSVSTAAHSAGWTPSAAREVSRIWRSNTSTLARCSEVPAGLRQSAITKRVHPRVEPARPVGALKTAKELANGTGCHCRCTCTLMGRSKAAHFATCAREDLRAPDA